MDKLNKNNKGFGSVELVLIVIIIAMLGVVGWFVYKNQHKTTTSTPVTKSTVPATKSTKTTPAISVDPYVGWQTVTSSEVNNTNFKIPSDWVYRAINGFGVSVAPNTSLLAVANSGDVGMIRFSTSTDASNSVATFVANPTNTTNTATYTYQKMVLNSVTGYKTVTKVAANTLPGTQYYSSDPTIINYAETDCFDKNNVTYCASLTYNAPPQTYIDTFELIVKSWVF
jgi:cytoskeletal protein RodZ